MCGDLLESRRYADDFELNGLAQEFGLTIFVVEAGDADTCGGARSRLYSDFQDSMVALARLREGRVDCVFVRYEHRSYQHFESVEFRDGRSWRLSDAVRARVENSHGLCPVSAALRELDHRSARLRFLELLGFFHGSVPDTL